MSSDGPTHTLSVSQKLHALADFIASKWCNVTPPVVSELRAAAEKAQLAFETWLAIAEHAAFSCSAAMDETKAATKLAWDEYADARAAAASLLAKTKGAV